jgi:nitroimidazol reductase NimA-like FMN-containing flavoprotein (pyridoxamine 5'-phosphate oxidase superfamily)
VSAATLDPLEEASLRAGHRWLLETFRELLAELEGPAAGAPEAARAVVAFLRQSVMPFASHEEAVLGAFPAEAEGAALDHAFIAAEVEALAAEVRAAGVDLVRVRRRLHRLEAVLELHLAREEEREARLPAAPAARPLPAPSAGTREMDGGEVRAFLRTRAWGTLSTWGAEGPYAVPVGYGWDGRQLYLATGPGRKLRNLQRHPAVCLTVAEVESGERWRCAVATGVAEAVEGPLARARALRVMHRQRTGGPPSAADLLCAVRARVFRVVPSELTGRERG